MTDEKQKDEFELWLEGEYDKSYGLLSRHMLDDDEQVKCEVWETVLDKYRQCKKQIESDDEPQALELTWDDKVMILNLYHCPLETIHPLLKHDRAKNRLDKLVALDYVWINRAGTDYVISSKGGSLVMEWKQEVASHDK